MAVEGGGGGGSSNMVRAGGAVVEVVAKDNTGPGLAAAKKSIETAAADVKKGGPGGTAATAQLNTDAVRAQEMAKRGAQLTKESQTAAEKYRVTQFELNKLLTAGAISQTVFARQTKKAADELREAKKVAGGTGEGLAGKLSAALAKFGLGKSGIGGGELAGAAGIGLVGGVAVTGLAALAQAGSAASAASIENLAPVRAKELRGLGAQVELDRMRADMQGPAGREALRARLEAQAKQAQGAVEVMQDRMRATVGGQQVFDWRSLPGGIGEGWTARIDHAKAKFDLLAVATDALAQEIEKGKLVFKQSMGDYRATTANLGYHPELAAVNVAHATGQLSDAEFVEKRKAVFDRLRQSGFWSARDYGEGLQLATRQQGQAPEAAGILAQKDAMRKLYMSPDDIDRVLRVNEIGKDSVDSVERRRQLGHQQINTDFFRRRRDQTEMDALGGQIRESAFKGQLGMTGGYDYGGGGQWKQEMKSDVNKQIELARQLLEVNQQHRAIDEQAAKDLGQVKDAMTYK